MTLDEHMKILIGELEYLIGSECYNPHSYDGWNDIEGRDFRYPVSVPDENGEYYKVWGNINSGYRYPPKVKHEDAVLYMKYKFGANELFVGKGIIKVLEYLEKRYGIDFNKLEQEHFKSEEEEQ